MLVPTKISIHLTQIIIWWIYTYIYMHIYVFTHRHTLKYNPYTCWYFLAEFLLDYMHITYSNTFYDISNIITIGQRKHETCYVCLWSNTKAIPLIECCPIGNKYYNKPIIRPFSLYWTFVGASRLMDVDSVLLITYLTYVLASSYTVVSVFG